MRANLTFALAFFTLFSWFVAGCTCQRAPLALGLLGLLVLAANLVAPHGL